MPPDRAPPARSAIGRSGGCRSATLGPMAQSPPESSTARALAPRRLRRELTLLGGALGVGVLVIPLLIWVAGHATLGPYTHGDSGAGYGPLTLYRDYLSGLGQGWIMYWLVATGPLAVLVATRLWLALVRRLPRR